MLTNYILIPFIAALAAYILNKSNKKAGAVVTALVSGYLLLSLAALYGRWDLKESFNFNLLGYQLEFLLAINPLSWLFAVMTAAISLLIALFSIQSQSDFKFSAAFNLNFLLIIGSIIGIVFARDFLTLFIFWELMTWTSFYLISAGKKKMAGKAAYRYLILSAGAAYAFLMASIYIFQQTGSFAFDSAAEFLLANSPAQSILLLAAVSLPFIVKAGIFPLHIWVKDAHGNAPKEFSPFLSGMMLKVGIYGLLVVFYQLSFFQIIENTVAYRGLPLLSYLFALLGAVTIITGTILAIRQEDMKKLIAYSSISQMGYIIIGIAIATPLGFSGSMLHLMNHLIFKSTIFLALAAVIYRTGTTKMYEMGGLIFKMPLTFAAYLTAIIALAGIPPTNGFISKWVIYQALIEEGFLFLALAAFFGSIASFMYVFKPLSTVFLGQLKPQHQDIKEVPLLMKIPMLVLIGIIVLFGVFPGIQMNIISQISGYLGIETVNYSLYSIQGAFGAWNSLYIFNIFSAGFVIALLIFGFAKKSKLVGLLDTYSSGEYVTDAESYHYAYQYYRPFDRVFDNLAAKSLTNFYETLTNNLVRTGEGLRRALASGKLQNYALYSVLLFVILAAVGWII
ncbi:proton-conducting transporter transmembrane domain-containing protein [Halanaerobium saccharolyticum]|uniref:proton-conducting transporter transmembrane domain-containing protein n=1 Tax=Halanaerobium saccharolyticum TaxID=43595 RepID=UPI003FCC9DF1